MSSRENTAEELEGPPTTRSPVNKTVPVGLNDRLQEVCQNTEQILARVEVVLTRLEEKVVPEPVKKDAAPKSRTRPIRRRKR